MAKYRIPKRKLSTFDVDEALLVMSAEELREIVHDLLDRLDRRAYERVLSSLMERAARGEKQWVPTGPSKEVISEVCAFARQATNEGYAAPEDMDDCLRQGSNAFLSRDYQGALRIFHALLSPLCDGEINLGQHEMVDEVLTVDIDTCTTQYVIASYMTTAPEHRAKTIKKAIIDFYYLGYFGNPIEAIEKAIIEPLPDFDRFLRDWRDLLEADIKEGSRTPNNDQDRWLREIVEKTEGADGLAKVARASKKSDDYQAWCEKLVDDGDWNAALAAYNEAVDTVSDSQYVMGCFLDGAALAAQELGKKNFSEYLERAWRASPCLLRLVRRLGTSKSKATLTKRANKALSVCQEGATRQRAFLHFLLSDFKASAVLLSNAEGLGWSNEEHPGHLMFPLFYKYLGGPDTIFLSGYKSISTERLTVYDEELYFQGKDKPILNTPTIDDVIDISGAASNINGTVKKTILKAMKTAAERRIEGVTGKGRRNYYLHAAQLVAACAALDSTPETSRWVDELRSNYRRYPALQTEFSRVLE